MPDVRKIDILNAETGEVRSVNVATYQTVASALADLGYCDPDGHPLTLVRDDFYLDPDSTFMGRPSDSLFPPEAGESRPYRIGFAD